jgi:hypothetical protein
VPSPSTSAASQRAPGDETGPIVKFDDDIVYRPELSGATRIIE